MNRREMCNNECTTHQNNECTTQQQRECFDKQPLLLTTSIKDSHFLAPLSAARSHSRRLRGLRPARPGRARLGMTLEPSLGTTALYRADVSRRPPIGKAATDRSCPTASRIRGTRSESPENGSELPQNGSESPAQGVPYRGILDFPPPAIAEHMWLRHSQTCQGTSLQRYLTYKKTYPPKPLPQAYA